jgi:hypothetical protein
MRAEGNSAISVPPRFIMVKGEKPTWEEIPRLHDLMKKRPCLRCCSEKHRGLNCPRIEPGPWCAEIAGKPEAQRQGIDNYIKAEQEKYWSELSHEERQAKDNVPPSQRRIEDSDSDAVPQARPKKRKKVKKGKAVADAEASGSRDVTDDGSAKLDGGRHDPPSDRSEGDSAPTFQDQSVSSGTSGPSRSTRTEASETDHESRSS